MFLFCGKDRRIIPIITLGFFLLPTALLYAQNTESLFLYPVIGPDLGRNDKVEVVSGRGLLLRTSLAGATVYIDGISRGQTPLMLPGLRDGEYFLQVRKTGYRDREMRIRIAAGSRLELYLELEELSGRLYIHLRPAEGEGRPFRPEFLVDGEAPKSPAVELTGTGASGAGIYELLLSAGYRQIRVRAFGWEDALTSRLIAPGETVTLYVDLQPAEFRLSGGKLSRPRFNPLNTGALGTTALSFEVSAPGQGTFSVLDAGGRLVYTRELPAFSGWFQQVSWDGRDAAGAVLGDGAYTLQIDAGQSIALQAVIDSSLLIYPLSLFSAMPGLFYAPSPALLPPGSFQIEGSIIFGQIPAPEGGGANTFKGGGLPFELGLRFSPLSKLELSAAFDAIPAGEGKSPWGFSLSAKWLFLDAPLGLALLGNFSWSSGMDKSPQREGASLIVPLSWELGQGFSLLLSAGLFWPDWDRPAPRLLLSLGPLFNRGMFSAGLSLRGEFDFSAPSPVTLFGAGELRLFPPPSNLVFTLLGGFWNQGPRTGGFGGFALGTIF